MQNPWFPVQQSAVAALPSPALLVDEDRVRANLARMITMAGGVERLRPHVKTHKMPAVIELVLQAGITKCKCATFEEMDMAARAGIADVLLAKQPVGPDVLRFVERAEAFAARESVAVPGSSLACIVDDPAVLRKLAVAAARSGKRSTAIDIWIDVDVGFGRHGTAPARALELAQAATAAGLRVRGWHVYDGHLTSSDPAERAAGFAALQVSLEPLLVHGPTRVVGGGSPTFGNHAGIVERGDLRWECSPGTPIFWDWGYGTRFPELGFEPAAMVMGRVISRPGPDTICIDIGSKAVAPDPPVPRIMINGLEQAQILVHNEEHLLLRSEKADHFPLGKVVFGIPVHICPTVHLYSQANVVRGGKLVGSWQITARR